MLVDSGGTWALLRERACAEAAGGTPGSLFEPAEGFYLGCSEAAAAGGSAIEPAVPKLTFTSCAVAVVQIEVASPGAAWWTDVRWEILEEAPLRGRRGP